MKKIIIVALSVFLSFSVVLAQDLKVGDKAENWSFSDSDDNPYTLDNWKGMVLFINYVDPDEKDMNEHVNDAMKKATNEGILDKKIYKGIGIVDCDSTWKPNSLIKSIAGKKAKKFKTIILFDYKAELRKKWNLKEDSSNVILLDKNGVCRAIYKNKLSPEETKQLVELAVKLQNE